MADIKFDTNDLRKHVDHNISIKHLGEPYNQVCLMCLTCRETLVELDDVYPVPKNPEFNINDYVRILPHAKNATGKLSDWAGYTAKIVGPCTRIERGFAYAVELPEHKELIFLENELELLPTLFKVGDYVDIQPHAINENGYASKRVGQIGMVIEVTPLMNKTTAAIYDVRFSNDPDKIGLFYGHELELHETLPTPPEVKQAFAAGEMFVVDPVLTAAANVNTPDAKPESEWLNERQEKEIWEAVNPDGAHLYVVKADLRDDILEYSVCLLKAKPGNLYAGPNDLVLKIAFRAETWERGEICLAAQAYLAWVKRNKK